MALSTLRSRRKAHGNAPEPSAGLPTRPASSSQQVELDYGSEETPNGAPSKPPAVVASAVVPKPPSAPEPMDVDEGQAREEGEISDTESTPPPKVAPQVPVRTAPARSQPIKSPSKDRSTKSPVISSPSIGTSTLNRVEAKTQSSSDVPINPAVQLRATPLDDDSMQVDEEYIRPGLLSASRVSRVSSRYS